MLLGLLAHMGKNGESSVQTDERNHKNSGNQPRKMMNHADLSIDYDWARGFDHEKFGINSKRCWSKHQEWVCLSSEMGYNGHTTYVIMCIYIYNYVYIIYIHIYTYILIGLFHACTQGLLFWWRDSHHYHGVYQPTWSRSSRSQFTAGTFLVAQMLQHGVSVWLHGAAWRVTVGAAGV